MIKLKCMEKIRDKNNNIIEYKLVNSNKEVISTKSDDLKESIRSGQIEVINLTLTSDNRLIDKKPDTPLKFVNTPLKISTEVALNKAKALGFTINTFDTDCGHKCYVASSKDNKKHFFIIPDDVKYIYKVLDTDTYNKLRDHMSNIRGILKAIGGKNLISTRGMFFNCELQYMDLSSLETSNVTDMSSMFCNCKVHSLVLTSFETSFDTSKVTNMRLMFDKCVSHSLDLRSFDTSNVTNMCGMFNGCETLSLDLSSFNTGNVKDMNYMFYCCYMKSIDLRSFDTSKVTDMHSMFGKCEAQSIDLSSFNTSNVTNMNEMFYDCEAQVIKVNDPKLKSQLQSDRR